VIDAKEAVKKAKEYLANLYNGSVEDMKLEEIEIDDSQSYWIVTISFFTADKQNIIVHKEYKTIKIKNSDGEVLGMKIARF